MTKESGFICGGVVSQSIFDSDPWAYMMCYYMVDDRFKEYQELKAIKQPWAEKEANRFFKKHAISAI